MQIHIESNAVCAEVELKNGRDGYRILFRDGHTSWSPKEVFEKEYRKSKA